jgi:hypothetical protein
VGGGQRLATERGASVLRALDQILDQMVTRGVPRRGEERLWGPRCTLTGHGGSAQDEESSGAVIRRATEPTEDYSLKYGSGKPPWFEMAYNQPALRGAPSPRTGPSPPEALESLGKLLPRLMLRTTGH